MVRNTVKLLLTMASVAALFSSQVLGRTLETKKQHYLFNMAVTQNIATETFVITPHRMTVPNCPISMVHFRIGSAVIAPQEEGIVFSDLGQCNVEPDTPLVITGHTCELGSVHYNKTLSMQRAQAVVHLLQAHGFTVAKVQGKGAQDPITRLPEEFYKNRRVEIEVMP